jgi:hypothetical protein
MTFPGAVFVCAGWWPGEPGADAANYRMGLLRR